MNSIDNRNLNDKSIIKIGNLIEIHYSYFDNLKQKINISEGIVIAITKNSFTIYFILNSIIINQIFFFKNQQNKNIIKILKKNILKINRSKLYYLTKR